MDLADDTWHRLALTVSDVRLDLYIDCEHRFQRQILPIDKETLRARNLTLWLGQRGLHHFAYQVSDQCLQGGFIFSATRTVTLSWCSSIKASDMCLPDNLFRLAMLLLIRCDLAPAQYCAN